MLNTELAPKSYLTEEQVSQFFESTKRGRKQKKKKAANCNNPYSPQFNMDMKMVKPLTKTQSLIFKSFFESEQNLFLHGYAGTGKSFISTYLLMKELLSNSSYEKLVIIRSTVPSRDQGFLPGNAAEKAKVYERPYYGIYQELFGRADSYEIFKKKKQVEFESTSYLRGTTFNNCLVLLDEFQNCTFAEMKTVLTRIGENCRIIISGDYQQTDLKYSDEKEGIIDIMKILKRVKSVDFFEFKKEDIVRSGFVKDFLIAEDEYRKTKF